MLPSNQTDPLIVGIPLKWNDFGPVCHCETNLKLHPNACLSQRARESNDDCGDGSRGGEGEGISELSENMRPVMIYSPLWGFLMWV